MIGSIRARDNVLRTLNKKSKQLYKTEYKNLTKYKKGVVLKELHEDYLKFNKGIVK